MAEVREEEVPSLRPGQVLIRTIYSAISPGTELLVYRQQIPTGQALDVNIKSLPGEARFPLKYGYSTVGEVISTGPETDTAWTGKRVFAFHPHESLFPAYADELIELPEGVSPLDAVFLSNMETAVNFIMDGKPMIGERIAVLGQGIVGLLTISLLAQFPLKALFTMDKYPLRRRVSCELGAHVSLDPDDKGSLSEMKSLFLDANSSGADLTYEISGNTGALDTAIEITGYDGRILVGSWYGTNPVNLRLGEGFHRNRIRLISSQVSTLSPGLMGRWNKSRRFQTVWQMLEKVRPSRLINQYVPFNRAAEAYKILEEDPGEVIQTIFTYRDVQEDNV
jgi:2-desacetyl-2-hydroxyethyl bacteriochlorophyllide A dehydrogenase